LIVSTWTLDIRDDSRDRLSRCSDRSRLAALSRPMVVVTRAPPAPTRRVVAVVVVVGMYA